jgi:hypothetical protein
MPPLFPIPGPLTPPASNAQLLYGQNRFEETVAFCQKELPLIEKQIRAKSIKLPEQDEPNSPPYQYYALTLILVDALAELRRWKAAKEVLGKYRVHFPRDPWGFVAGAEVTRRDPAVKDPAAVQRAIELLEGEAKRLKAKEMAAGRRVWDRTETLFT